MMPKVPMPSVKLLSWATDISVKTTMLKRSKVAVDTAPLIKTSSVVRELASLNPAALVLDLDKLPSNSREISLMLRASKSARHIPILLLGNLAPDPEGGLPDKYARLKSELPDIPYATWPTASVALTKLLQEPRTEVYAVPPPRVYTASLAQKLGVLPALAKAVTPKSAIKERKIALIAEPDGFIALLGDLPETVKFTKRIAPSSNLAICFIRSLADLAATLDMLTLRLPPTAAAWIAYPKRSASTHRDFNENDVRNISLAAGFIDYKICSIDAEWSAMKFAHRKRD